MFSVINVGDMLQYASLFNGDLSKWDVSSVTIMDYMFQGATSFNQNICEPVWVHSKATKISMFTGSSGSISRKRCASPMMPASPYVKRRPIPERELILRTPTAANTTRCQKCAAFRKSGRLSCCAPGGAWNNNCGGPGNGNVDHRWFEGIEACKRKFKAYGMEIDF